MSCLRQGRYEPRRHPERHLRGADPDVERRVQRAIAYQLIARRDEDSLIRLAQVRPRCQRLRVTPCRIREPAREPETASVIRRGLRPEARAIASAHPDDLADFEPQARWGRRSGRPSASSNTRDVFLGHIGSHFVPGRNLTWYLVFLAALAAYLSAVDPAARA